MATKLISRAVFNYLQEENYFIDYEYCGNKSSDDAVIAEMIDLTQLTLEDVQTIVNEEYRDRLADLKKTSVKVLTKALSYSLCGAWIAKRDDIKWGYHRFFDGLQAGESTSFFIL
jgi:hypothetical protein